MDLPLPPERDALIAASETASPECLLESGLLYVRQGRYIEGLTFFALARERLSPDQEDLAALLDAFIRSHKIYSRAQEDLLQASRHFSEADAEQRMQLVALENCLANLLEEMNKVAPTINRLPRHARSNRLLHILRLAPEGFNSDQLPAFSPQGSSRGSSDSQPLPQSSTEESMVLPALSITCFGRFEVKRLGSPVVLCANRHGQTILRYLVAQADHCATCETLMALLWPEDEPEIAQPRLHTAICALRRSLNHGYSCEPGGGYIVCKNRAYYLGETTRMQSDVDQFLHDYQRGRQASDERVALYEKACHLYTGPFLPEDKYADWSFLQREHLSRVYIDMCKTLTDHYLKIKSYEDAEKWATAVLKENHYDEAAHRQLMQIYATQGRRSEALQQFQRCERMLHEELAVQPLPETMQVVQMILKNDSPSAGEVEI